MFPKFKTKTKQDPRLIRAMDLRLAPRRGFTLVEVAIALAVILIAILAMVKIFPMALKVSTTAEQATVAANLGQAKIEEMFYLDYDNITIGTIETKHRLSADPANPFYQYQRQTISEYVDSDLNTSVAETGLKRVTVTTYWNSPIMSAERNQDLIILIAEK